MEQRVVERSIWIDASRERVWQALTEPEQLADWLLPPAIGARMKRATSGDLVVCMGEMEIPFAVVEESEPPQRYAWRTLPEQLLTTTCTLEEEQGGTRVKVAVTGFELLAPETRQDRAGPISTGWEKALENLKAYRSNVALPFPEGYVAALSGYRRDTQHKHFIERSIWIKAPRDRVWRAITDPQHIQAWFSPTMAWELSALEPGGRLYHRSPETGEELYVQIVELVDPPRQLVTRSAPDPSGVSHATMYTLEEERGGTRLNLTFTGLELLPEEMRWALTEQHAFGFGMMLGNVRAHVEGASLPYPGGF